MKIQRELPPNPDMLVLHTNIQLRANGIKSYSRISKNLPIFVREILLLRGVVGDVFVNRYDIHVQKGPLFSWDKLMPKIIKILQKHFSPKRKVVILKNMPFDPGKW